MIFVTDVDEQERLFEDVDYYIGEYHETIPVKVVFNQNSVSVYLDGNEDITNHVPHISFLDGCQVSILPSLKGTVLWGNMHIPRVPINRMREMVQGDGYACVIKQEHIGKFYIRADDIEQFKDIKIVNMPFHRRKTYLRRVLDQLQSPYIVEYQFFDTDEIPLTEEMCQRIEAYSGNLLNNYPSLYDDFDWTYVAEDREVVLTSQGYYEYLCMCGNRQGVRLKNKNEKFGGEIFVVVTPAF